MTNVNNPHGININRVTEENRYDVDKKSPELVIALYMEDAETFIDFAVIPNTREMPDIVEYDGHFYEAYDTTLKPPAYRAAFHTKAKPMEDCDA